MEQLFVRDTSHCQDISMLYTPVTKMQYYELYCAKYYHKSRNYIHEKEEYTKTVIFNFYFH